MHANAPGKLIISGEHSVVYGAQALALALDIPVRIAFTPSSNDRIRITGDALPSARSIPLDQLPPLKAQLDARYERFVRQQCRIEQVLDHPSGLLLYTLAVGQMPHGGDLHIHSEIPVGAGMGSSAACIAALLRLCESINGQTVQAPLALADTVRHCERLQHGRGSVVDAAAVCVGGALGVKRDTITPMPIALSNHWFIWHSGAPQSSTGECVSQVRTHFAQSTIWQTFDGVTTALVEALTQNDHTAIAAQIRANQQLLSDIGVVPEAVNAVIQRLNERGIAAKVCGAGSVRGDGAGQVLIYAPEHSQTDVERWLNAPISPLLISTRGAFAHD